MSERLEYWVGAIFFAILICAMPDNIWGDTAKTIWLVCALLLFAIGFVSGKD